MCRRWVDERGQYGGVGSDCGFWELVDNHREVTDWCRDAVPVSEQEGEAVESLDALTGRDCRLSEQMTSWGFESEGGGGFDLGPHALEIELSCMQLSLLAMIMSEQLEIANTSSVSAIVVCIYLLA